MSQRSRVVVLVLACGVAGVGVLLVARALRPRMVRTVVGAVLIQDQDPRKQAPIPNVEITAEDGAAAVKSRSDSSGFFRLDLRHGIWPAATISLHFRHPDYDPLDIAGQSAQKVCVVRMVSHPEPVAQTSPPEILLSDIRVRYAMKDLTTMNVGSMVRAFEVVSAGNMRCDHTPCSPDGKWKAATVSRSFDAGEGHEFRNVRVSCIAGPCPFTRIGPNRISQDGRIANLSVLNWSDTATFLFEAEVVRSLPGDVIRQLYPAIFGRNLNFTLPATAQGPSIEAEMNGAAIVFPLGPTLRLSWAICSLQVSPDRTKLYSCELKPGYRFR